MTHHLLQGGAASEGAGEQREAVDEGGEEVAGQRRQSAPGEHGDQVGDDVGESHRLGVLDLNPGNEREINAMPLRSFSSQEELTPPLLPVRGQERFHCRVGLGVTAGVTAGGLRFGRSREN